MEVEVKYESDRLLEELKLEYEYELDTLEEIYMVLMENVESRSHSFEQILENVNEMKAYYEKELYMVKEKLKKIFRITIYAKKENPNQS